jgi:predicted Zn finger-like uncharacterized protein
MAIPFQCPQCQKAYRVKDHLAGKKVACAQCKHVITVPALTAPVDSHAIEAIAEAALDSGERAASNGSAVHPVAAAGTIAMECPYCFENVEFPAASSGRKAPCPSCRRIIDVPAMKVEKPKDWRTVTERPTLAKVDTGPAPEGAWGNTAGVANVVSREALREAEVIVDRKKLARPKRTGLWITLASFALVGAVTLFIIRGKMAADDQRENLLADAIKAAEAKPSDPNSLPAAHAAPIHIAAGTYELHDATPDPKQAARRFAAARNAARQADSPNDRAGLLLEVLTAQAELIQFDDTSANKVALSSDEIHRELRQTLQIFRELPREYGWQAIEMLTRKLKSYGTKEPMIFALAPEALAGDNGRAEALAVVALTMKSIAEPADKAAALVQSAMGGAMSPRVVAHSVVQAAGKSIPEAADVATNLNSRLGCAEGYARAGEFDKALPLISIGSPEEQVAVVSIIADAVVDAQMADKLTELVAVATRHTEKFTLPAWAIERTGRACRRGARADLAKQLADACEQKDADPWLELESLRAQLATSSGPVNVEAAERCGEKTAAQALACLAIARHNAKHTQDNPRKAISSWALAPARSVGMAGAALGLQDRAK